MYVVPKKTVAVKAAAADFCAFFNAHHKAAGIILLMITLLVVVPAKAEQPMQLASAAVHSLPNQVAAPAGLFGTLEVKSNNISTFKKWTSVLSRFKQQVASGDAKGLKTWTMLVSKMKDLSKAEQIKAVNDYFNALAYVEDIDNYKKTDYWATPLEFISSGKGDCEDYAVAKYAMLESLGFTTDELRVAVVHDQVKRVPHAILVVYTNSGQIILDNQSKALKSAADITRYKALFSINEQNWWLHRTVKTV